MSDREGKKTNTSKNERITRGMLKKTQDSSNNEHGNTTKDEPTAYDDIYNNLTNSVEDTVPQGSSQFVERRNTKTSRALEQRIKARERMAMKRADPEYASREREKARQAKARKRKDPTFLEFERARNREFMALKRQDPAYASMERERARLMKALKRRNDKLAQSQTALN